MSTPAFPRPYSENTYYDRPKEREAQEGMDLRDYFAAAALTGLLSAETEEVHYPTKSHAAFEAYEHADAMLKAREGASDE